MLQARRPALCYYRLEELRRKRKEHSHERKTILGPCCSLVWYYSPHWTAETHPGTAKAVLTSSKNAVGRQPAASFTQQELQSRSSLPHPAQKIRASRPHRNNPLSP